MKTSNSIYIIAIILLVITVYLNFRKKHTLIMGFNKKEIIQTLIRQASRWSIASESDKSPLISLLHANYGVGYVSALRQIASDTEIYNSTGINIIEFESKITNIQDKATRNVSTICPQFVGELNRDLLKIAGNL